MSIKNQHRHKSHDCERGGNFYGTVSGSGRFPFILCDGKIQIVKNLKTV